MRIISRLFDFYIFANIHVALATFSLTKISLLFVGNEQNEVPLFVFFSTIVAYNYIRLSRKPTMKSWFSSWIDTHKMVIVGLSLVSFMAMCYLGIELRKKAILSLVPFFIATFFYAFPYGRLFSLHMSLRTIAGIKIFLIAFCWAGVTVLFPLLNYDIAITSEVIIICVQRFLFIIVITLPFDIRDLSHDDDHLKTIPQIIGVVKSKKLGLLLLMCFLGLAFLLHDIDQLKTTFVIALISLMFLIRSTADQHKYYSAFFVESIPIIWLLLVLF